MYFLVFRHPRYGLYNPAYEQMSLPIDPYIRIFQELLENGKHLNYS